VLTHCDHPFTILFLQILEEIGSDLLDLDRKLRRKLPLLVPILKKITEVPLETLINFCQTFYSSPFNGKPISLPLSFFGGCWLLASKLAMEDVRKLFTLIRQLLTYAVIKLRSDEGKELRNAENVFRFVLSFLLSIDEEKKVPSWRLFLEHLDDPEFSKILKQILFSSCLLRKADRNPFSSSNATISKTTKRRRRVL